MNNREIKFRVWDKSFKKMVYASPMAILNLDDDDHELMQFTGLKDKNNVEIFEGDKLVAYRHGKKSKEGVVVYGPNASFVIECEDTDTQEGGKFSLGNPVYQEDLEVIGNIYEN